MGIGTPFTPSPNRLQKVVASAGLISVRPTMAMVTPVPLIAGRIPQWQKIVNGGEIVRNQRVAVTVRFAATTEGIVRIRRSQLLGFFRKYFPT